ncbi:MULTISPECIES: hypothetical protein [unclassified Photorhabdus]|uniref:hypothetical protein n=1 Tax=unclassified Photorhabdus TaxID=2620880 RepID=UPI000F623A99|nr:MULTISPECIES: hypothetical protein [unclassified Photorhabdus]MCZ1250554.1 hypothetical protein [Photorhabdus laumondii subsp. laumondii]NDK95777.1 hypothetical protein [Photorhabdus laumondii subsp. laumondii]
MVIYSKTYKIYFYIPYGFQDGSRRQGSESPGVGSIDNYVTGVTGVSECSQQRSNLKDNGYMLISY